MGGRDHRSEIMDVSVDGETRRAIMLQLTAERERRAAVTRAEGELTAAKLRADGELYTAQKAAEARRVTADADAYSTGVVARAIEENGLDAIRFEVAKGQIAAMEKIATGQGAKVLILPTDMGAAFGSAAGLSSVVGEFLGPRRAKGLIRALRRRNSGMMATAASEGAADVTCPAHDRPRPRRHRSGVRHRRPRPA